MIPHSYEPQIDGLRALAVTSVLLFHAGLPGFNGGFVGVDVFFVISGYLITRIIQTEIDAKRFSLWNFYERRARRILPALLTVLFCSILAGAVILVPSRLTDLAQSSLATLTFVSNIWFWRTIDYFSGEGHPLLHTWSLGVEEQFYIFFPLALLFFSKFGRSRSLTILALLGSLTLSIILTEQSPAGAFYLLPTRAWELLIGAVLFQWRATAPNWVGWLGMAAILGSVVLLDESTHFPGAVALVPTLGAAAVIAARQSDVARLLSLKPFVGVGLISYSLYLWHWPVLVFSRELGLHGAVGTAMAVLSTVVLAILTWEFVEQPFRDRHRITVRGMTAIVLTGSVAAACVSVMVLNGLPQRFSAESLQLATVEKPRTSIACENTPCSLGSGRPTFGLWGDSHAAALGEAVDIAVSAPGKLVARNACPPIVGYVPPSMLGRDREECAKRNARLLSDKTPVVMLSAYWQSYLDDPQFIPAMQRSNRLLVQSGRKVFVVLGLGEAPYDLPQGLAQQLRWKGVYDAQFETRGAPLEFRSAIGVPVIDLASVICPRGICPTTVNDAPVFFDSHHLSGPAGRTVVAPVLRAAIRSTNDRIDFGP